MFDSLLTGAFDTHVHAAPDVVDRSADFLQVARAASDAGMSGLVFKDVSSPTVDRAFAVNRLDLGCMAYGGVVLDLPVGGINPRAVERTLRRGGQIVWMPVAHSRNTVERFKGGSFKLPIPPDVNESEALSVLDGSDSLNAEARDVVDLVGEHDAVLASGHLSPYEAMLLFEHARKVGVRRMLINHPAGKVIGASHEDQRRLADLGAYMEHCFAQTTAAIDDLPLTSIFEAILAVGSDHCLLATDLGQTSNPVHVEGLELFASALLKAGVTEGDLDIMMKENPSRLFTGAGSVP